MVNGYYEDARLRPSYNSIPPPPPKKKKRKVKLVKKPKIIKDVSLKSIEEKFEKVN